MTKEEMIILYPNIASFGIPESILKSIPEQLSLVLSRDGDSSDKHLRFTRVATITETAAKLETKGFYSYEGETKYYYRSKMKNCTYPEFVEKVAKKLIREWSPGDRLYYAYTMFE